jgi:hypothetical protein
MRTRIPALVGVIAVVGVVALLLLVPLPLRWHGGWQTSFFDLGHVPLFAVVTVCLWLLLGRSLFWAALISLVLAALGEVLQYELAWGRTGDFADFVRGAVGVGIACVGVHAWQGPRTARRLTAHALAVAALLAWPLADTGPALLDAYEGYRAFPTLAEFQTPRELGRWECTQSVLRLADDPAQPGAPAGRLELLPGPEKYPGAELDPVVRDWNGYHRICCAFAVEGEPLQVVFSLRTEGRHGHTTHYQVEKRYEPGEQTACLDLATAVAAGRPDPLDLGDVRKFHVFIIRPGHPHVLWLHRIWVE